MGSSCCKGSQKQRLCDRCGEELDTMKFSYREPRMEEVKLPHTPSELKNFMKGDGYRGASFLALTELDMFDTTETAIKEPIPIDPISRALLELAVDLLPHVDPGKNTNVVFSPLSIALALAMAESGATGKAQNEIQNLLVSPVGSGKAKSKVPKCQNIIAVAGGKESPSRTRKPVGQLVKELGKQYGDLHNQILEIAKAEGQEMHIANTIFFNVGITIDTSYRKNAQDRFKVDITEAPFSKDVAEALKQINQWVSQKTTEKIPELYKPCQLDPASVAVLVNAIFMDVALPCHFDFIKTVPGEVFWKNGKEEQLIPVMWGMSRPYMGRKDFHATELMREGMSTSMYIILPRRRDGLDEIEKQLSADFLIDVFTNTRPYEGLEVHVHVPKFSVRSGFSLIPALPKLGFSTLGQFGRISSDPRFKISDIRHEACIQISDEKVRTVTDDRFESYPYGLPLPYAHFLVKRPFIFVIVHKPTWTILFLGKMYNMDSVSRVSHDFSEAIMRNQVVFGL